MATEPDLVSRDRVAIASAQKLRFFPLAPVRGSAARLYEEDGRELIDLSASWSAAGLGHGHPAVVAAVTQAVADMPGASVLSQVNPEAVGLAEELIATMPAAGGTYAVYLGSSGSDANAAALRCARAATGRHEVIAFAGSYHGGLGPGRDVSGLLNAEAIVPAGSRFVPYPSADDWSESLAAVRSELSDGGVAAVIVEPVMSDGGVRVPPVGFLAALASATRAGGAVLICDEVKAGLGRTGLLHTFQIDDVAPDIAVFGKSLGGGLPMSAAVGIAEVMNAAPGSSLLTTAGNPVCAAAGRAVLRTVIEEQLPARAAERGQRLLDGLAEVAARHDIVTDVRGRGLLAGIELPAEGRFAAKVCFRAYHLGIVCYYVGPESNVVELTPPLIISEAEIDRALDVLDQAIGDVVDGAVTDADIADYAGW